MKQIRFSCFETNSSSTHSLIICTEEMFKMLEEGTALVHAWKDKDKVDSVKNIKANNGDLSDYQTLNEYFDDEYQESFEEHFITPSGDKMVAFGKYGRD